MPENHSNSTDDHGSEYSPPQERQSYVSGNTFPPHENKSALALEAILETGFLIGMETLAGVFGFLGHTIIFLVLSYVSVASVPFSIGLAIRHYYPNKKLLVFFCITFFLLITGLFIYLILGVVFPTGTYGAFTAGIIEGVSSMSHSKFRGMVIVFGLLMTAMLWSVLTYAIRHHPQIKPIEIAPSSTSPVTEPATNPTTKSATTKSSGPVPVSKIIEARKNIISAIKNASNQTSTHGENDTLAFELFLKSWASEFQAEVLESVIVISAGIQNGFEAEPATFTSKRNMHKVEWVSLLTEFASDVACTGPLFMLTVPDGKNRASKIIDLLDELWFAGQSLGGPSAPVREQRTRLCNLISTVYRISHDWIVWRWNKDNPGSKSTLKEEDWPRQLQLQYKAIREIREAVHDGGVDRWISPTLGTSPGLWTTDLLATLREMEGHLWVSNPKEDVSRLAPDHFDSISAKLGTSVESLRWDFVRSRKDSEEIVLRGIGKLEKLCIQLQDADISRFG